ncbi:MAG: 30S ribosomal protein S8e [Candidatus Kariarchaeaceae archaeon]|jgi:small subunit ribosomal protein S8e
MVRYQGRSGRLITGGRIRRQYNKKKKELGRPAAETHIAEERKRVIRVHGGSRKTRLYRTTKVNLINPKTGKASVSTIKDVTNNPASREFTRRRIITKGAILDTEMGQARVTNRPSSEGFINAVIIEE